MTTTYPRQAARRPSAPLRTAPLRRLAVAPPLSGATLVTYTLTVMAIIVGGMFASLMATTYAGQVALESQDLRVEVNQAVAARQRLESEVARAESPEHLLVVARKMGMVPAANPVFLRLSDHAIIGRRIPARSNGS